MAKNHAQTTAGRLVGKVVLISGAASGMGAEHARFICREGGRVVIGDIAHEAGYALAVELNGTHGEMVAHYAELDVTVFSDWQQAVEDARSHFGALHGLVNNAGIGSKGSVEEATP